MRRRGEEAKLQARMHPAREVAIAREKGGGNCAIGDGIGHVRVERPRIADAGGASMTHDVEAGRLQIRQQSACLRKSSADGEPGANDVLTQ